MYVLAAILLLSACKGEEKVIPQGTYDYSGTMVVTYFDVDYNSDDIVVTAEYDKAAKTVDLLFHHVKFVPMMPVTIDVLVPDIPATADGKTVAFSGRDIIPTAGGIEYDRYEVGTVRGTLTEDSLEVTLNFGDYPTRYTGDRVSQ